jgi:hypothetical protein
VVLGGRGLKWLLHPHEWRDLGRPGLPAPLRRRLVVLAATAVVPVVSLGIPFWMHLRRGLSGEGPATR